MAGLIGSVTSFSGTGLGSFLLGETAATKAGRVEQFRGNLRYDYGDVITGAASDGVLFDIRVKSRDGYEFGDNLSFERRYPVGVYDVGDSLVMDASKVRRRLEQNDLARMAYGLLLASKGEISQSELNEKSGYAGLFVLNKEDALDRLNIDAKRSFRVNGVEFKLIGDEIQVSRRPGQGASNAREPDPEIEDLRRQLAKKQAALGVVGDSERVKVEGATISSLIGVREDLESRYTYVSYSFETSEFVASNNFADVLEIVAEVPDAFFFGANVAMQLEDVIRKRVPAEALNEIFPVAANYFSGLVLGALTGLPTQVRDEFYAHTESVLKGFYGEDDKRVTDVMDKLRDPFEQTVERIFDAVAAIKPGADLKELRKGLGIELNGSVYTVRKYALPF